MTNSRAHPAFRTPVQVRPLSDISGHACFIEIEHEVNGNCEWTRYFARGHYRIEEFRAAYASKLISLGIFRTYAEANREAQSTHVRHVFLREVDYRVPMHVVCDASVPCAFAATVTELV